MAPVVRTQVNLRVRVSRTATGSPIRRLHTVTTKVAVRHPVHQGSTGMGRPVKQRARPTRRVPTTARAHNRAVLALAGLGTAPPAIARCQQAIRPRGPSRTSSVRTATTGTEHTVHSLRAYHIWRACGRHSVLSSAFNLAKRARQPRYAQVLGERRTDFRGVTIEIHLVAP